MLQLFQAARAMGRDPGQLVEEKDEFSTRLLALLDGGLQCSKSLVPVCWRRQLRALVEAFGQRLGEDPKVFGDGSPDAAELFEIDDGLLLKEAPD